MAYFRGGTPRNRIDGRRNESRTSDLRLLIAGVVAGIIGLLALGGVVPRAVAPMAIVLIVLSLVPGRLGGLAAVGAVLVSVAALVVTASVAGLFFAVLVVASALLARTAATSLPGVQLLAAVMSPDRLSRESVLLDERAHAELTRARRYERPLSIVAIVVESQSRHPLRSAADAGRLLSHELRVTDVVGVTQAGEAVAILPDTGSDVVSALVDRLSESARAAGTDGAIGYASFPDDAVTWRELQRAAYGRRRSLAAAVPTLSQPVGPLIEGRQLAG